MQLDKLRLMREKTRGMSSAEILKEVLRRANAPVKRRLRGAQAARGRAYAQAGASDVARALSGPFLPVAPAPGLRDLDALAAFLTDFFPEIAQRAMDEADAVCQNRLRPFTGQVVAFGEAVDWRRDYATGRVWPLDHHTRLRTAFADESDIRRIWEFNRFQHATALGRAYVLTGDERYADTFAAHVRAWVAANPVEFGPNWCNAMEAGIRAVNLIVGAHLMRASRAVDDLKPVLAATLVEHGRFIEDNLEFSYRITSNHFLSDLVGLLFLGEALPAAPGAARWSRFARETLFAETRKQVLDDGVDYEASTAYHRFVIEILLHAFLLVRETGHSIPVDVWSRFRRMFDVVRFTIRPDGTMPLVGDNDDGRLVVWHERPSVDHEYVLAIAATVFDDASFKRSERIVGEPLWLFGADGYESFHRLPTPDAPPQSKAFPDGGLYALRSENVVVVVDCGGHGISGRGSHNHNDALSFDLFGAGRPLLVDPGSYVYTASPEWRNRFRSTLYHNTVRVDEREISAIHAGQLFALGRDPQPRVLRWETSPVDDVLTTEHSGYADLADPVVHRREFRFDKRREYLVVDDTLDGAAEHVVEFSFTFDAGCTVTAAAEIVHAACERTGAALMVLRALCSASVEVRVEDRFVSRAYGEKTPCQGVVWRADARLPLRATFLIVPALAGETPSQLAVRASDLAVCEGFAYVAEVTSQ